MSLRIRRLAVVSLAALALTAGGVATAAFASASAGPAQAVSYPGPDGADSYQGGGHERPLRFGPFEFPRAGTVSGGFAWNTRG